MSRRPTTPGARAALVGGCIGCIPPCGSRFPFRYCRSSRRSRRWSRRFRPATRKRHQVIARQALADPRSAWVRVATVLAPVVISREEESVVTWRRAAGNVMNFTRRMIAGLGTTRRALLAGSPASASTISACRQSPAKRPSHGHHGDGFKRSVQSQAAHIRVTSREGRVARKPLL